MADFVSQNGLAYNELVNMLHKLGLEHYALSIPLEKMSQGQRKKAELARSLLTPAQLYIWDEPLNYLDAYNQDQLPQLIKQVKPTMLLVEHDRRFIDAVADETVILSYFLQLTFSTLLPRLPQRKDRGDFSKSLGR